MIHLQTRQLCLRPRTLPEMERLRDAEADPELRQAYAEMCACMRALPGREELGCDWLISLPDGTPVGGAGFKGAPDARGAVEIGYSIDPPFRRRGYAREAVRALCAWALEQPDIRLVQAQTLPQNAASQGVLAACGFLPDGQGTEGPLFSLRPVCLSWEHNGQDTLLWSQEHPGVCTRGASLEEALSKMPREIAAFQAWRGLAWIPRPMRVTQEKSSSLQIRDADSDILLDGEREPLTPSQYEVLRDLCLRSARDFLALYCAVPQKQISSLVPRATFYGPLPRTAEEMYEHTRRVNGYYFGEIGVEADCLEDDILRCRERGFAALQAQPGFLDNRLYDGSYGEEWTLRKVMRRFLWHDRIHARALRRMAARTFPHASLPDPFCFERTEKEESR